MFAIPKITKPVAIAILIGLVVVGLVIWIVMYLYNQARNRPLEDEEQDKFITILHPIAQPLARQFVREVEKNGYKVIFTSTYRSTAQQAILYAQDNRNARAGRSYHNYGLAWDINLEKGGTRLRKASPKAAWEATGAPAIAQKMNLFWGANIAGYHDPVHFDLSPILRAKGLSMDKLVQIAAANPQTPTNKIKL